jgi:predicted Zn-dependent protease
LGFCIFFVFVIMACVTVPETGRQTFILIPESEEIALGFRSYQEILQKSALSTDQGKVAMVRRVGRRIADAADRPAYAWEFNLIEDDEVANAFCLPGGKVAVYSGILKYTENENGLATVLGHEVAHALTRHGGERMTNILLAQMGQAAINAAVQNQSASAIRAVNVAYGAGANIGFILPFSRFQELEADRVGLILMAKAGYDPREAARFWQRMSSQKGPKAPEFLSTHPADAKRIAEINKLLPEALKYYRPPSQ